MTATTRIRTAAVMSAIALAAFAGCNTSGQKKTVIRMATTTSTENSGLLDHLLPVFEKAHDIDIEVIAVGTGKAIRHGENGDVDLILVHARAAEDTFVSNGYGIDRRDVMYNDFVLLGPASDPAGIAGTKDIVAALKKIASSASPFVSRGDDSGTHKREMSLWKAAGTEPAGDWYLSAGQGMGACLILAHEKQAYVLTDRGTYIAYRDKIDSKIAVEGDARLYNPYGVIAVNPEKHAHAKYDAAKTFIDWLVSDEAQDLIAGYTRDGEQLFYPNPKK